MDTKTSALLTREQAARKLTKKGVRTTAVALANQASNGTGPRYAVINGRAIYREEDLDGWLAEQFDRPVTYRKGKAPRAATAA